MKKLILLLFTFQFSILTLSAQAYQMRAAIEKAVFSDKLLTINSYSNSGFDESAGGEECRWSVLQYEFSVKQSDATVFEPVMKAFDKDRKDKRTTTFVKTEATQRLYSFQFSAEHQAITIGSQAQERALVIIVGDEKPGQNTVIAMEAWQKGDVISGNIYIIERDPSFKASPLAPSEKPEPADFMSAGIGMLNEVLNNVSENIRRLTFYSQKYEIEASNFGGAGIVKAAVYVVSDIIQSGTEDEKKQAKFIIDNMIMATQSVSPQYPDSYNQIIRENTNTLLNLLTRLDAKTEYSTDMKSTPNTFRINGKIDPELWDIGYYISMSDPNMGDPTLNPVLIKAEGQTFHYQTDLDQIRLGRIRALFKDGTICSAWIEILFVPGETAELTVHNGTYSLEGTGFYKDWDEARRVLLSDKTINKNGTLNEANVLKILKDFTDKPAFFVFAFKENWLPSKEMRLKAYNLLPDDVKQSPYGVFLRKYL